MSGDNQMDHDDIWRFEERIKKYIEKAEFENLMRVGKVRAAGVEDLWNIYMDVFWPLFATVATTVPETSERKKLHIYMADAAHSLLQGMSDYFDSELYLILSGSLTAASLKLQKTEPDLPGDDAAEE